MKVLRSTLLAAAVIGLAACGDKVNVVQPPTPTPGVTGIVVAPATATLSVGATLNLTAAVSADAGATFTVVWSTSDASKVSVSATGTATAVAVTPGVAVCAAAGGKSACASIIVANAGGNPVAGTVSIAAVNFTNGFGQQQPAPVPPGAVGNAGSGAQVNVVMNLNVGTTLPDSIVLRIGTPAQTAYKQAFSAAQVAALRAAAMSSEVEGQLNGTVTITASVNVADYCSPSLPPLGVGPSGTCPSQLNPPGANTPLGAARWQNGNQAFQAFYYGKQVPVAGGAPVNTSSSSPVSTYRFANFDGFHLNMAITPVTEIPDPAGAPSAVQSATPQVDLGGFAWKGGTMALTAWFIQYTPGVEPNATLGLVQASFNNFGCSVGGVRSSPMVKAAPATGVALTAGPWTATFIGPTVQGAPVSTGASGSKGAVLGGGTTVGNVIGIEFNPAVCPGAIFTSGGEIPNIVAVGTDNNNILSFGPTINGGVGIINTFAASNNPDQGILVRLDNVAPPAPAFSEESAPSAAGGCSTAAGADITTFGGRSNCFFNDGVVLNGLALGYGTGNALATSTVTSPLPSANGVIFSGTDVGSGRQVGAAILTSFSARADLATVATATVDAEAAVTSTASLGETNAGPVNANRTYQLRVRSTDPINNTRNSAAGVFDVDRTAPALAQGSGNPNGSRIANVAPGVILPVSDVLFQTDPLGTNGALGSGFNTSTLNPLTISQARRQVSGTTFYCPATVSYVTSGTGCTNTLAAPANNGWVSGTSFQTNYNFCDVHTPSPVCNGLTGPAAIADAYYTAISSIVDQAGNRSAPFSLMELVDQTSSNIGGLTYAPAIIPPGGAAAFSSASIADNLDIQGASLNLTFGTSGAAAGLGTQPFDGNTAAAFAPTTVVGGATFWYNSYNLTGVGVPPCAVLQSPYCDFAFNTWPLPFPTAPVALMPTNTFLAPLPNIAINLQVPTTADGGAAGRVYTAGNNLNNANGVAFNQACSLGFQGLCAPSGVSTTSIPATAIPASVAASLIDGTGGNATGVVTVPASTPGGPIRWNVCGVGGGCPVTIPNPAMAPAASFVVSEFGLTPATPTSVFLVAVASGLTATTVTVPPVNVNFANPFAEVQFWAYNTTANGVAPVGNPFTEGWRLIGSTFAPNSTTDAGLACTSVGPCGGRNWAFGITWTPTPATAFTVPGVYKIMAIGITNAASVPAAQQGMALATPVAVRTVTVVP